MQETSRDIAKNRAAKVIEDDLFRQEDASHNDALAIASDKSLKRKARVKKFDEAYLRAGKSSQMLLNFLKRKYKRQAD